MPSQAFYCSLCSVFAGDAECAHDHLKSNEHNENYQVTHHIICGDSGARVTLLIFTSDLGAIISSSFTLRLEVGIHFFVPWLWN